MFKNFILSKKFFLDREQFIQSNLKKNVLIKFYEKFKKLYIKRKIKKYLSFFDNINIYFLVFIEYNRKNFDDIYRKKNKITKYYFNSFSRSNQNTYFLQKPIFYSSKWIQGGDLLGDCSSSSQGELCLGKNLLVAYMSWEGFNFEDAILINKKVLSKYISLHIEKYELQVLETPNGNEKITRNIDGISSTALEKLDDNGIIKIGSWVNEGDILVGKVISLFSKTKNLFTYERLLYDIIGKKSTNTKQKCLKVPNGISGRVIKICYTQTNSNQNNANDYKYNTNTYKKIFKQKFIKKKRLKDSYIDQTKSIFFSFNNFFKNRVKKKRLDFSKNYFSIFFKWDLKNNFKFYRYGKFIFNIINGVILKKKILKKNLFKEKVIKKDLLKKVTVYIAEKRRLQVGDKMSGRHGNKGIVSKILSNYDMPYLPDGTTLDILLNPLGVPSRMNVGQILECLLGFAGKIFHTKFQIMCFDEIYGYEASRSFVYSKLLAAYNKTGMNWVFSKENPGKLNIFDGRTGQAFNQPILVGSTYILKLIHIVDEKIHARTIGPYSLILQQPLRGRAKHGGQRIGEMEVWALQGFGVAYTLQEILTIKSDDIIGRNQILENILNNTSLKFGTPESTRILLRELQCLCLDLHISK